MLHHLEFHHIGIATKNIPETVKKYTLLGYTPSTVITDTIQNSAICFLKKAGQPLIELIEPLNEESPVYNLLKKTGTHPYHICYKTEFLTRDIEFLKKHSYIVVQNPVRASALAMKEVCFLFNKDFGIIELVSA